MCRTDLVWYPKAVNSSNDRAARDSIPQGMAEGARNLCSCLAGALDGDLPVRLFGNQRV